jgi:hypothetical protein
MNDTKIYFGDAVKALDENGRVGGYLIRFSQKPRPRKDLSGQYFTKDTYLGASDGNGVEAIFEHGFPVPADRYIKDVSAADMKALQELSERTFAPLKTRRDAIGIFAETVLNLEDEYEKFIFDRVKANKIGWSSGAAGHRVKIKPDGEITHWTIAEGSLTPRPCEPLNRCYEVKSLGELTYMTLDGDETSEYPKQIKGLKQHSLASRLSQFLDDSVDDGKDRKAIIKALARESMMDVADVEAVLEGEAIIPSNVQLKAFSRVLNVSYESLKTLASRDHLQTIKGMFEQRLADQTPNRWQLDSIFCEVVKIQVEAAKAAQLAGLVYPLEAKIDESIGEYMARLKELTLAQAQTFLEGEGEEDDFYLRAILKLGESDIFAAKHLDLDDHSHMAVSALKEVLARFKANHEARKSQKAGRVLSQKNRERLAAMLEQIKTAVSDCQSLLDESQPMASESDMNAAKTAFLHRQWQQKRLGVQ